MKRSTIVVSFIFVLAVLLVSCSNDNDDVREEDGKINISVFVPQGGSWDLETNSFTALAEEMFDLKFDFQTTTWDGNAAAERRKIVLSGGNYPDLFLLIPWVDQFSQTELMQYGQQGVAIALNDLIDEHAPNIKALLDSHPYFKTMATAPDGNIYGIPQLIECFHCSYPAQAWINTSWLEELDLDMPTTHEEFADVLRAFKNDDPNGNGKPDEVPMSGTVAWPETLPIPFLMNGFIYDDMVTRLILDGDKVDFVANKPEWKEGLAYIASLYDEDLIDPGAFTQNADAYRQLGNNAEIPILGVAPTTHPGVFVTDLDYQYQYDPIGPLQGPHAQYTTYKYSSEPGGTFVLTNKSSEEARVAAIKLLDYMFTVEGQLRSHFGEEDVGWRAPQEGDVAVNEDVEPIFMRIEQVQDEEFHNTSWGPIAQYYQPREFRDGWIQEMNIYSPDGYNRRLQEATNLYEGTEPDHVFPHWAIWVDPDVINEFAMLETNIQDYVNQHALQFITGVKDLDKDWDEYVQGLERLNLERYLEIMQQAYDQTLE